MCHTVAQPKEVVGKHLVGLDLNDDLTLVHQVFHSAHDNEAEVYIEPGHKRVVLSSSNSVGV